MNKLWRVARHEFKRTAANKAFVIMTILGPFLIIGMTVLPSMLSMSSKPSVAPDTRLGIICENAELRASLGAALTNGNLAFKLVDEPNIDTLKNDVREGNVAYGLSLPADILSNSGYSFYSKNSSEYQLQAMFGGIVGQLVVGARLKAANIDPSVTELIKQPNLEVVKLSTSGKAEEVSGEDKIAESIMTVIGFLMLIYMSTLLYGQMIGRSVVTEKTSKTVEIMLSSVSPSDLMFGKVLGIGLAGILQYAVWLGMSFAFIGIIGPAIGISAPAGLSPANLGFLLLFFLLAYFLYSSAYAAIGAAAEDEQHLAQLAWPVIIFLVVPIMMVSPIIMNPNAFLVQFMSYFPLTAPLVMLIRVLTSSPEWYELAICVVVLLLSIWGMVLASAKIFRIGILMTGKRFKFGEIVRWIGKK